MNPQLCSNKQMSSSDHLCKSSINSLLTYFYIYITIPLERVQAPPLRRRLRRHGLTLETGAGDFFRKATTSVDSFLSSNLHDCLCRWRKRAESTTPLNFLWTLGDLVTATLDTNISHKSSTAFSLRGGALVGVIVP